jgi:hypothetical protein
MTGSTTDHTGKVAATMPENHTWTSFQGYGADASDHHRSPGFGVSISRDRI